MQQQRREPAEREEEGLLQPQQYEQDTNYQEDQPTTVKTAPQPATLEREKPTKAPRMHTAPQPVC